MTYVPCSGITGDNLHVPLSDSWYKGPTLIECIGKVGSINFKYVCNVSL